MTARPPRVHQGEPDAAGDNVCGDRDTHSGRGAGTRPLWFAKTVSGFTVAESVLLTDAEGGMGIGRAHIASDAAVSAASMTRRAARRVVCS